MRGKNHKKVKRKTEKILAIINAHIIIAFSIAQDLIMSKEKNLKNSIGDIMNCPLKVSKR